MKYRYISIFVAFSLLLTLFLAVGFFVQAVQASGASNLCGSNVNIVNGLGIKKDVFCEKSTSWTWNILKSVDQPRLTLSTGQQQTVNYTVTASAAATSSYHLDGMIRVVNTTDAPISIDSVVDSQGPVSCDVSFPNLLAPHDVIACTYSGDPATPPPANEATANITNDGSISVSAAIDWSLATTTEIDECTSVSDSFGGPLGTVCAGQTTSKTFTYSRTIGPYAACGEYDVPNTASFVTNDTGSTSSASADVLVNVPCAGGCSLTLGYWKTHSEFGPAPYDNTWAMLSSGASTPFYLSGQTWYQVFWTSPSGGNAYYILAHQYMAARLNQLNGASSTSAVDAALVAGNTFFNTYTPSSSLSKAVRNAALANATTLENYNTGVSGPGHCSE